MSNISLKLEQQSHLHVQGHRVHISQFGGETLHSSAMQLFDVDADMHDLGVPGSMFAPQVSEGQSGARFFSSPKSQNVENLDRS